MICCFNARCAIVFCKLIADTDDDDTNSITIASKTVITLILFFFIIFVSPFPGNILPNYSTFYVFVLFFDRLLFFYNTPCSFISRDTVTYSLLFSITPSFSSQVRFRLILAGLPITREPSGITSIFPLHSLPLLSRSPVPAYPYTEHE